MIFSKFETTRPIAILLSKTGEVPRPEWLSPDRELHVDPASGEVVRREVVLPADHGARAQAHAAQAHPGPGHPGHGHTSHGHSGHGHSGHGHGEARWHEGERDEGRGGYDDDAHASRRPR